MGLARGLSALLVAALLGLGVASCGGGSDSTSSTSAATQGREAQRGQTREPQAQKQQEHAGAPQGHAESQGEHPEGGQSAPIKPHHDSGGGSAQFRVKGGDNSIQEFGAEADASEFKGAAAALHGFFDARAVGDWRAACTYLAKSVVESLSQLGGQAKGRTPSCAELLGSLTNPAAKEELRREAEQADVGSLRVEGERAFVIYRGLDGTVLAVPMTMEGGAWKVGSLGGTPLS